MKKVALFLIVLFSLISLAGAELPPSCSPTVTLLSQDPYPAIPGDYTKLVFQVEGVENPICGTLEFDLVEDYPFSLDPGTPNKVTTLAGGFNRDYDSLWLIPYKVRIDEAALDGDTKIEAIFKTADTQEILSFNVNVEDSRTKFEVSIKDYILSTNTLTFEILNTGENDVEAVTIELETQKNAKVKGSKRNIIGSLDSNEDTTFSFEATPNEGPIKMKIYYTDGINERHLIEKEVTFEPEYFSDRARDKKSTSLWIYVAAIAAIIFLFFWTTKKIKHKKLAKKKQV